MESHVTDDATVTAADVLAAQARLRRYLAPTPLHHAERFGCWLKLENLQRTGSYKVRGALNALLRSEEHTSELQSLMRISYAVFCLKKKKTTINNKHISHH